MKKLDGRIQRKITVAIEKLEHDPRPHGAKKLIGRDGWRIRIGNYRVVYVIEDGKLLVMIIRVAHRKDVYR